MSEFSADWLALREPADRAARSRELARLVAGRLALHEPMRVLDLGAGTGANLRFLADQLPGPQQWTLVDRDAVLLRQVAPRVAAWAASRGYVAAGNAIGFGLRGSGFDCRIATRSSDLSKLTEAALFDGTHLVTASALLDLVSLRWLELLAARCREAGATVLFALTFDGGMRCQPEDADDEVVRGLVNRHQQTSKGFGRALGPAATDAATRVFEAAGYEVVRERSDWQLTPAQGALQRQLVEGWAAAATEMDPGRRQAIEGWTARRLEHLASGVSHLTVGHFDLAGWPS